jgi:hypothetical protein
MDPDLEYDRDDVSDVVRVGITLGDSLCVTSDVRDAVRDGVEVLDSENVCVAVRLPVNDRDSDTSDVLDLVSVSVDDLDFVTVLVEENSSVRDGDPVRLSDSDRVTSLEGVSDSEELRVKLCDSDIDCVNVLDAEDVLVNVPV